ncbi:MAG: cation transporter [Clostridia bacterium]|nr:cation transporter [Clostridia bacterium]
MKKVFRIEELDCAHCAQRVEDGIRKLDGVINVQVNFLSQKLVLEVEDSQFDEVLAKAKAVAKKVEPDCEIIEK